MYITLIRHPPIDHHPDQQGRCYGRLDYLPCSSQLDTAQQALADYADQPIICSPAQRCLLLAQRLSQQVQIDPAWQELDFGQWEGLAWDDIPRAQLDDWAADIWHYRVGQTGETAAEMWQRIQYAIDRLKHAKQQYSMSAAHSPIQAPIIITHAGVIRMLLAHYGHIDASLRWTAPILYATPYTLEI